MNRKVIRVSYLPLPIFNAHEEEWDIISLPDNICTVNPIHSTSKVIQNFVKKIKNRHESFIQNFGVTLDEINKEVEDSIRMKSKLLKKDFNYLISNGQNYIHHNLDSYKTEILNFDDYKFEKCKKYCSTIITQGKSKIYDFYAFLKSVEKFRAEKFKEVLMNFYDDLLKINTKSPYEVQLFFEDHILSYNQIVLANLRNYKEIEVHLILVYTNEIKLMLYNITKYEECWKDLCRNEIINRLKEYNVKQEEVENVLFKNESILKIIKLFNSKIEAILEQMEGSTGALKENTWLENMKTALEDLDITAKQLINVYKLAADELYNKYYIESETVMEKMINKKITNLNEISDINKSLANPLNNMKRYGQNSEETDINKLWKETVEFVLEILYTKFNFLEKLETIFINHERRVNDVKELIVQDFKQLILKHDNILQVKDEATLNIILDNMRRDSTKNALGNTLKRVQVILNKIKQTIEKQKEDQLRVVKKFYDCANNELNILKTELNAFIEKYSEEPTMFIKRELNKTNYTSMFKILKQTRDHFNEIGIWKRKIIENIGLLIVICQQDQQNKVEQWVTEQEEYIITNFESKLEFHKCRFERIKKDVYEVRLAEIQMHEARFTSHSNEIQKYIENLFTEQSHFEYCNSTYALNLNEYVDNAGIEKLENIKDLEIFLLTSQSAIQKRISSFEETMKNHSENVNTKLDGLYSQNLLFLKSMKLFHEGGNFSSAELKLYTKKMRQLNNFIKKKTIALKSKIQNFDNKIVIQMQEIHAKFDEKQKYAKLFVDFKNDVKNQLKNVQTAIKNVVVETKTAINKTQSLNERLLKLLQFRCDPYGYLSYVIADCKGLNERFSQHQEHLQDFEDAPKLRPLPLRHSSNASTKKSNISITRSGMVVSKPDQYKLFDNETDLDYTENKFLSKIRKILITNFHDLEKKAKKFYAVVKREDCAVFKISHNIRSFIWGVLHKFTYYYLQCLQIWIIQIRDFVGLVHNLRKLLAEFCEKYLKHIHDRQIEILEKTCNKYLTDIKQNMNSAFTSIKNTSDQLKPLYGYPGNQKMLNDLNEKMTSIFEEVKSSFFDSVIEPKKYVENALNEYLEILTKEKDKIEELHCIIPEKNNYENLVNQVKNIMFTTNFDNLLMPLQCTEIIDNSEVDIGNINEIMLQAEPPRSRPVELKEIFLQIFAEILGEKIDKIYEVEFEFLNTIPNLKKVWYENVQKVIELYKIKYN